MKVTTPIAINDARLTSSTIAEPDTGEVVWNAATSYVLGDVVIRTTTHKKYENILAGVDAGVPESTPTRWLDLSLSANSNGITNRWAMFDTLRNTQSIKASPVTVVLTPNSRIDSIGLLSVDADSVDISIMNGAELVYTATRLLNTREVLDWYDYYFAPFKKVPNVVFFDIPPYSTTVITLTFTSVSAIKIGAIILGNQTDLGKAVHGVNSEELNFSRIEREVTGESILLPRRSVPKITIQSVASPNALNLIRDTRANLNAVPAVWSGLDDKVDNPYFDTVLLLGVYKKFEVNMNNSRMIDINLEIEEI